MARSNKATELRQAAVAIATRSKKVRAAVCPKSENHTNTRVYRTVGKTRFCVCDECGETWKQIADEAENSEDGVENAGLQFLADLAESLETSPTRDVDKVQSIVMPVSEIKLIVERLRAIASGS